MAGRRAPAPADDDIRSQYPNAWIPLEAGDRLEGVVVDVTRAYSDARARGTGNGFYPLVQVQTNDGPILNFHAFSAVSYSTVMEKQPLPGERIVVTYTGEGKAKDGRSAPKLFVIQLPGRDPRETARNVYARLGGSQQLAQASQALREQFPDATDEPADTEPLPF